MRLEACERRAVVREGYQILMRAEARLCLPQDHERIASYYQALAEKCMTWAIEVRGECLRREFSALADTREKARFSMRRYSFVMSVPWEDEALAAILCESYLSGEGSRCSHRLSHVWNLQEQTILPPGQIEKRFLAKGRHEGLPFRPDGIYPSEGELVYFRNARGDHAFAEVRRSIEL